jgi:hypothetical protein
VKRIKAILATGAMLTGLFTATAFAQDKMSGSGMKMKMSKMTTQDKAGAFDKLPESKKMSAMKMACSGKM